MVNFENLSFMQSHVFCDKILLDRLGPAEKTARVGLILDGKCFLNELFESLFVARSTLFKNAGQINRPKNGSENLNCFEDLNN